MKLENVTIRKISIPFVAAFQHSLATRNTTESIILEVVTDKGIKGYGECTPRNYVTGETISDTMANLQHITPFLKRLELTEPGELLAWLDNFESNIPDLPQNFANARCAVELALLDALGKALNQPVIEFFGKPMRDEFSYSGIVSSESPAKVEKLLYKIKMVGFKQIKLKVGQDLDNDLANLNLARSILGPEVEIRIDVNAAWNLDQALEAIPQFIRNGVRIIEQPLPAECRDDYPKLMNVFGEDAHIIVDESVCTFSNAAWFIENRAAAGFNLKIAKHGGLLNTLKIYRLAQENGLSCQLGCHVGETSILTAAGIIFSGMAENLVAVEGGYGKHLLEHDVVKNPLQFGSRGKGCTCEISSSSGLGIQISESLLNTATSEIL